MINEIMDCVADSDGNEQGFVRSTRVTLSIRVSPSSDGPRQPDRGKHKEITNTSAIFSHDMFTSPVALFLSSHDFILIQR